MGGRRGCTRFPAFQGRIADSGLSTAGVLEKPAHAMPALCLILACALWGLSFPVVKVLHIEQMSRVPGAGSEFLSAWIQVARFGLGALILLPFIWRSGWPTRLEIRQGLRISFWGGIGMVLQADGLAHTSASTSAFLTQAYCVILPLVACIRLRKPPETRTVLATLLVMAGGAILCGVSLSSTRIGRGELETLIAAALFSIQILILENPIYQKNRGTRITFVMCVGIAVMFVPVSFLTAPTPAAMLTAGASWQAFGMVAVLALFCSVGAYLLMNHWQPRVSATEAGLLYTTEPVFTAVYALFLPAWLAWIGGSGYANETLTPTLLTGGGLILAANVMMHLKGRAHPPTLAPSP
jgi:drug/metabolite transporter (DMT)-like permease